MARQKRAEAPSRPVPIRLSPQEKSLAREAAELCGQTLSDFCRDAIVTAVAECTEAPASFRITK